MINLASLHHGRYGHSVVYHYEHIINRDRTASKIEEFLYVLGGRSKNEKLLTMETYSFKTHKWRKLPDMPYSRVGASACFI